jgi:hypothetical protein
VATKISRQQSGVVVASPQVRAPLGATLAYLLAGVAATRRRALGGGLAAWVWTSISPFPAWGYRKRPVDRPLVDPPARGGPRRAVHRWTSESSAGPIEQVKTMCVYRHWFTPTVDMLAAQPAAVPLAAAAASA